EMAERSTVFDMDGKVYSRLQGENRVTVKLSEVSPDFVNALLAREDSRFYKHRGIDPIGIIRALVRNVGGGSAREGASTLTQQLARNSFPLGGKNVHRKLLEAFVSLRIEQHFSKDEILETYVNRIYFGSGVYGIETASLAYFGKHAKELKLGEAAIIAGIIRAPTYYSPFRNLRGATMQRDQVLERMAKLKSISETQCAAAKKSSLALAKKKTLSTQENYAMDAVRRELDVLLTDEQRGDGGLKIYTTIDPALQRAAQSALDAELTKVEQRPGFKHPKRADFSAEAKAQELPTPYLQGALVAIDNRSGAIRALVGGRDFQESKYNRAIQPEAARQLGSTFKPFVYAAAFQRGMLPGATIDDGPIQRGEIRAAASWTPENSDGTYKGPMRAEDGLILSRNTMSVRVGERAGIDTIAKLAAACGIGGMPRQPSVYLGAFEQTVAELGAAYSVFANNGIRRQSYIIERIDDADGETIFRAGHIQVRAIDAGSAWLTTQAMQKVLERGTAASAKNMGFAKPAAGKTGTTNEFRDAWFAGFTSSLTCAVWVGLDKPETIVSRGYGAALALPVWVDVMNAASPQRYPAQPLQCAEPTRRVSVCATTNELATNGCERAGTAYAVELPESHV
ncbi:MAG TPA: PBP1A family penicillin-binding protein, partial [Chthoniobacteraceae bacterium]|nr:PBP1A family penicillin-binding protein [Chthoniobacteraceae bacterium]